MNGKMKGMDPENIPIEWIKGYQSQFRLESPPNTNNPVFIKEQTAIFNALGNLLSVYAKEVKKYNVDDDKNGEIKC